MNKEVYDLNKKRWFERLYNNYVFIQNRFCAIKFMILFDYNEKF